MDEKGGGTDFMASVSGPFRLWQGTDVAVVHFLVACPRDALLVVLKCRFFLVYKNKISESIN